MIKAKKTSIAFFAIIMLGLAGFGYARAEQEEIYYLTVDYAKDNYSVQSVDLAKGGAPDYKLQLDAKYRFDLVSAADEVLYSANFDLSKKICGDAADPAQNTQIGGCRIADQGSFSLAVPYYPSGTSINLYDPDGKTILQADVSDFARLCGDNVCQENESALTCAQDCKSGIRDNVCDGKADGVCDPDCKSAKDPDCAVAEKNYFPQLIIMGVLLLVLAGAAVFAIIKIHNKKGKEH